MHTPACKANSVKEQGPREFWPAFAGIYRVFKFFAIFIKKQLQFAHFNCIIFLNFKVSSYGWDKDFKNGGIPMRKCLY